MLSRPRLAEAVLRFDVTQGGGQFVFMAPQLGDGLIARAHDLADLVAWNLVFGYQLMLVIARLGGAVCVEHLA